MKSSTKNAVQDDSDEEEDEEELFVMRGQASPRTPETLKDEALSFMAKVEQNSVEPADVGRERTSVRFERGALKILGEDAMPALVQRQSHGDVVQKGLLDEDSTRGKAWLSSPYLQREKRQSLSMGSNRSVRPSQASICSSMKKGLAVRDAKYKLHKLTRVFSASSALDWLVLNVHMSRAESLVFCQELLDAGVIKAAMSHASRFTDSEDEFFQWAEEVAEVTSSSKPLVHLRRESFTSSPEKLGRSRLLRRSAPILPRRKSVSSLGILDASRAAVKSHVIGGPFPVLPTLSSRQELKITRADSILSAMASAKPNLTCVSIAGLGMTPAIFLSSFVPVLAKFHTLQTLNLSDNDLGIKTLVQWISALEGSLSLTELVLLSTGLRDTGEVSENQLWSHLLGNECVFQLRHLNVAKNDLGDRSFAMLATHLCSNKSLTSLVLDENPVSTNGQALVMISLRENSVLQALSMRNMPPLRKGAPKTSLKLPFIHSPRTAVLEVLICNFSLLSLTIDTWCFGDQEEYLMLALRAVTQNASATESSISLSSRELTWIPVRVFLFPHLKTLDISHNELEALPWSLIKLQLLETLNVSHNKLSRDAMPVHLTFLPRLRSLDVSGNPLIDAIPSSVNWQNVNQLLRYFNQCSSGTFTCHQMRVLVLGDPRQGRTSVALRLANPQASRLLLPPARAVSVVDVPLSARVSAEVWDFGPEIMATPMHHFFMFEHSLFFIVFRATDATAIHRLDYWLELLRGKVKHPHVFFVATHADVCEHNQLQAVMEHVRERFSKCTSISVHALLTVNTRVAEPLLWSPVQQTLASLASKYLNALSFHSVSQKAVFLQSMLRAERLLMNFPVISTGRLRTIAEACKISPIEMHACIQWLEYRASCLFFDALPRLKNMVVIDPLWLVQVMGAISACPSASCSRAELASAFSLPDFAPSSLESIFGLLDELAVLHTLVRPVGSSYVIPFLLSNDRPSISEDDRIIIKSHSGRKYRRIYEVSAFLPEVFDQLSIRVMHLAVRHCAYWRSGFIFLLESPMYGGWDLLEGQLVTVGEVSHIVLDLTTYDRSGRVLHIICATVESTLVGWFHGLAVKRLVLVRKELVDLDQIVGEIVRVSASSRDWATLSKTMPIEILDEVPDLLLRQTKQITWNRLSHVSQLGQGAYGIVYRANLEDCVVAVKQITEEGLMFLTARQRYALFLQECWSMNILQHPKIISLIGVCFQPMAMVVEFMAEGDLRHFLDHHPTAPWAVRLSLLRDIGEGMAFAHRQWPPIVHRDLKSQNIFLCKKEGVLVAKVADLGLAEVLPKISKSQGVDNPIWAAAEVIQGAMYTEKADVWSFAIIMWETLFPSEFPYADALEDFKWMSLLANAIVSAGLRPTIRDCVEVNESPPGYIPLLQRGWNADPSERPSFLEIILHLSEWMGAISDPVLNPPPASKRSSMAVQSNGCNLDHLISLKAPGLVTSMAVAESGGLWLCIETGELIFQSLTTGVFEPVGTMFQGGVLSVVEIAGLVWLCNGEVNFAMMAQSTERKFKRATSALDTVWRIVGTANRVFAVGSLRGEVAVGEWVQGPNTWSMMRFVLLGAHLHQKDLVDVIIIAEASSMCIYSKTCFVLVDLNDFSASVAHDSKFEMYGHLRSMCSIPGLNQLWGFVESGIHILVFDLAGTLTNVIEVPSEHYAHNGIWLPPLRALSFVDSQRNALSVWKAHTLLQGHPAKLGGVCPRSIDAHVSLEDLIAYVESLEALKGSATVAHAIAFLKLRDQAKDTQLLERFLCNGGDELLPSLASPLLPLTKPIDPSIIPQVYEDVKSWLHSCVLLRHTVTQIVYHAPLNLIVLADKHVQLFHVISKRPEHKLVASSSGRLKAPLEEELDRKRTASIEVFRRLRSDSVADTTRREVDRAEGSLDKSTRLREPSLEDASSDLRSLSSDSLEHISRQSPLIPNTKQVARESVADPLESQTL